jgi:hypothetical protein
MQPSASGFFSNKYFLLFFLVAIHIAFWLIKNPPYPSSDDLVYFQSAKAFISGDYHLDESPKNHRLMVFVPTAFFIRVFGESRYVISLWTLLCSCTTIVVLFLFLARFSSILHAFASGLLLSTNTLEIDYSASLFPDVIVALFAFLFVLEIFKARINNRMQWRDTLKGVLFFYLGFLSKEIILLTLPFVLFILVIDFKNKNHLIYWKKFILVFVIGGIALNAVYYLLTGDFNFIYHSINNRHSEFYALHFFNEILARITYQPIVFFADNPGYVILFLILLHFIINGKNFVNMKLNSVIGFFSIYFIILLGTYLWLPISFNNFTFIQLDGRMWMLLLLPLSIIAGFAGVKAIDENGTKLLRNWIIIFALAALVSLIFVSPQRSIMFFMFAASAAIAAFLNRKSSAKKLKTLLALLIPAIILALRFTYENSNFRFH